MADMNDTNEQELNEEDLYELLGQDSPTWLEQAELLRMSAALIWEKFMEGDK